jgi:tetratricopeptide (TPR) repeat protein
MRAWTAVAALLFVLAAGGCAGAAPAPTHPNDPKALTGQQLIEIADALAVAGDTVRAQQYLRRAQQQRVPERVVLPRLLRLYVADGQYRMAIEESEHALRRRPNDDALREFLASLYHAVGLTDRALVQFETLVKRRPNYAGGHYALASLLRESSQNARASEHYQAYLQLAPNGEHVEEARAGVLEEMP